MAKQKGILKLRGTIGGLTFYKLNGQYYVRSKSSLDRKRVRTDPAFARSRACSEVFGQASRLAKYVYRQLSVPEKKRYTIGRLTAVAGKLLREGSTLAAAAEVLTNRYVGPSATVLLLQAADAGTGTFAAGVPFVDYPRRVLIPVGVYAVRSGSG